MGSSGDAALVPRIVEALTALRATIVVATAGAPIPTTLPANVHCAEYLPGELVAKRAQLVVCNGGSPTSQQALVEGVPVLGITRNMDQFLNMDFIVKRGAGLRLRADELAVPALRAQARRMLNERGFRSAAVQVAAELGRYDVHARFAAILRAATQEQSIVAAGVKPAMSTTDGTTIGSRGVLARTEIGWLDGRAGTNSMIDEKP